MGFSARRGSLTTRQRLEVLCVTWNVNEQKPEAGSPFFRWLGELGRGAGLACLALQEIEMGGQSVATAAVRDALMRSTQVPPTPLSVRWAVHLAAWCKPVLCSIPVCVFIMFLFMCLDLMFFKLFAPGVRSLFARR